jgi:hypothetical protein
MGKETFNGTSGAVVLLRATHMKSPVAGSFLFFGNLIYIYWNSMLSVGGANVQTS